MIDSVLGECLRGGRVEVSKAGGVSAPSTLEVQCPPASTRSSSDSTCWPMTFCCRAVVPAGPPGSPAPSWSVWPSRRCCWTAPATGGSWRSRATDSGTCFRICPSSPATTSACASWRRRSSGCSTSWSSSRRLSVTGCGCLMAPRSRVASRARPPPVGACRLRRLRVEPLALPPLLGISARAHLCPGRDADRL